MKARGGGAGEVSATPRHQRYTRPAPAPRPSPEARPALNYLQ